MGSLKLTLPDAELCAKFLALQTRQDIANLLEISDHQLCYHLYISSPQDRYKKFEIPKRSGGTRQITAPSSSLKIIQRKLNQILQALYRPKSCTHGFVRQKNILTNAEEHVRKRFVLNIDLEDFFPSINFWRVRGMFMSSPYNRNSRVATVLAQICCFSNELPQGIPISPIVSNMICGKMDNQLRALARSYQCLYTRYADDITFSTYRTKFPESLAYYNENSGTLDLGNKLEDLIKTNGFRVNKRKVRLQTGARRQQVTGLTVNKIVNVRRKHINQTRAMLHAWEKYGVAAAESEFIQKHDRKGRFPNKRHISFPHIVKGKIEFVGMVRGKESAIYLKFYNQLCKLEPQFIKPQVISQQPIKLARPMIITDGKTDWKHLEASLTVLKQQGQFTDLELNFHKSEVSAGAISIKIMCIEYSKLPQSQLTIFIFDNDDHTITKDVTERGKDYKSWRNNVFSFVIPVPSHRTETPELCIEMYYRNGDLARQDAKNRRLFLSTEFHPKSGNHETNKDLHCMDINKIRNRENYVLLTIVSLTVKMKMWLCLKIILQTIYLNKHRTSAI
jgi:RNA-directed DNA polymerase